MEEKGGKEKGNNKVNKRGREQKEEWGNNR